MNDEMMALNSSYLVIPSASGSKSLSLTLCTQTSQKRLQCLKVLHSDMEFHFYFTRVEANRGVMQHRIR